MNFESIKAWFDRWVRREVSALRMKGFLGLSLGPVALAAALTAIYWLLRLFLRHSSDPLAAPTKCFWITAAILPFLFLGNRLAPRRNLMEERMEAGADDVMGNYFARRQVIPLLFLWFVFTGPRLFDWAVDCFRYSKRVQAMDAHSCAAVIWILVSAGRKVPYEHIQRNLEWLNLQSIMPELQRIPGVLFLQAPPPGMTLTPELRASIINDVKAAAAAG